MRGVHAHFVAKRGANFLRWCFSSGGTLHGCGGVPTFLHEWVLLVAVGEEGRRRSATCSRHPRCRPRETKEASGQLAIIDAFFVRNSTPLQVGTTSSRKH